MISGCSFKIPNAEVCADGGQFGATCDFTRNGKPRDIPKRQWDKMRVGWFCMSSDDFAEYQKFIELVCEQTDRCTDAEFKKLKRHLRGLKI